MTDLASGRRLGQLDRTPVEVLHGVGTRKRAALRAMGIETVLDLLTHYPRRWADRTKAVAINELVAGDTGVVSAIVRKVRLRRMRGRRSLVEVVVDDGTGVLDVTFFNQAWRAKQLQEGKEVALFGRVDVFRSTLQMVNPVVEVTGSREARQTGRIVPIYPQSERAGISSIELAAYIDEALKRAGEFADPLPAPLRDELGLVGRTEAFWGIHRPDSIEAIGTARRRLAFDELLRIQVALTMRKRAALASARGIAHVTEGGARAGLVDRFIDGLPFSLTAAQSRVVGEIRSDLAAPEPMHRLLQGDVGSGKTVVALATLLFGVQGGYQGAFMVPTEVLAEQHFVAARELLGDLSVVDDRAVGGVRPVAVALVTSQTPARTRTRIVRDLSNGLIDLLVGTHALITEDVRFSALGIVVIDEQHRFGVDQRAALREKGSAEGEKGHDPDLLVMTATPIPRTAAMTIYGDLEQSTLDELPPGRAPTTTLWVRDDEMVAWKRVREEITHARQAFVVCPLIAAGSDAVDDDGLAPLTEEEMEAAFDEGRLFPDSQTEIPRRAPRAAAEERDRLASGELSGFRVGLLHGQLSPSKKEEVMNAFRSHALDVLVSTTVVEVGVDVPDATVMVIEDADRFGIAQLHQLRGRVGRGKDLAWCYFLTGEVTEEAGERLQALVESHDGFELAEVDLKIRGEGTILGARQKGRTDLRIASLRGDRDLVTVAREVARTLVGDDPTLATYPLLQDELRIFVGDEEAEYLLRS